MEANEQQLFEAVLSGSDTVSWRSKVRRRTVEFD
jgi:hypothetical protein